MKTLAHKLLDVEIEEGFEVPDKSFDALEEFLEISAEELAEADSDFASKASAIDSAFQECGFEYKVNGRLSHALDLRMMDCKGYTVLAYSAMEMDWARRIRSGPLIKRAARALFPWKYPKFPVQIALEPNHVFLIVDDGIHMLDWDATKTSRVSDFGRFKRYCVKKVPGDSALFMAYLSCGNLRRNQEKHEEALSLFEKAERIFPHDGRTSSYVATALFSIDGNNHPERALRKIEEGLSRDHMSPGLYVTRARIHKESGNPNDALDDIDKAITLFPTDADYFVDRAEINIALGKLDDALADVDHAMSMEPEKPDHYIQRAKINEMAGKFDEAIMDITDYITARPDSVIGYNIRGQLWRKVGNMRMARRDFEKSRTDEKAATQIVPREKFLAVDCS